MPEQHRRRLTSLEASFLYCEKSHEPMHIGGCSVYEGQISRATLLRLLEERLHLLPRYRQKVVCAPFGVAHPSWEDDPQFDLSRHVEEVTLPPPGDEQTLSTFGGQLFARPLDRAQPLWKLILVHGRQDANTAIIAKVHYAMVEGISGTGLSTVLHDLKPRTDPPPPPSEDWKPTPMPDFLALFQDALRDTVTRTVSGWTDESFGWCVLCATAARLSSSSAPPCCPASCGRSPVYRSMARSQLSDSLPGRNFRIRKFARFVPFWAAR